jgi:hypothetical protein
MSARARWHRLPFGWLVRLGTPEWRIFSERYQGVGSIPVRYHYLLGQRVTFTRRKANL